MRLENRIASMLMESDKIAKSWNRQPWAQGGGREIRECSSPKVKKVRFSTQRMKTAPSAAEPVPKDPLAC